MHNEHLYQIDKICAEIIVTVMEAMKSQAGDADKLYGGLCAKFDAAIRLCEAERLPADTARELLYPLAALADEVFMVMPKYRARWIANPLQLRYFGEVVAGTGFFSRLEKLTAAPEGMERQLKLYFACLALGFKGKYGAGGQSGLRTVSENLGTVLTNMRLNGRGTLKPVSHGNTRKKFLSLRKCLLIMLSLWTIAAAAIYMLSLVDFLEFLGGFL